MLPTSMKGVRCVEGNVTKFIGGAELGQGIEVDYLTETTTTCN